MAADGSRVIGSPLDLGLAEATSRPALHLLGLVDRKPSPLAMMSVSSYLRVSTRRPKSRWLLRDLGSEGGVGGAKLRHNTSLPLLSAARLSPGASSGNDEGGSSSGDGQ